MMNDNRGDGASKPQSSLLRRVVTLTIPLLVLVGGLEWAAVFYQSKASRLQRAGVDGTAEIVSVTEDVAGVILENEPRRARDTRHRIIHYQFVTETGEVVEDSFNRVMGKDAVPIGESLAVRYLPTDPSIHEIGVGHTETQTSALHWIAVCFFVLWVLILVAMICSALLPRKMTTREKRIQRMKQLQQNE